MTYNKINIESTTEDVSQFKLKMVVLLFIALLTTPFYQYSGVLSCRLKQCRH